MCCILQTFDETTVQSLLQLFEYNTLEQGVGISFYSIEIESITLLIKSGASPIYHTWYVLGFQGRSVFAIFFMHMVYPLHGIESI